MLAPGPTARKDGEREAGYTLAELLIVLAIMSVVLLSAGTAMISLTKATNRDDGMVTQEQQASNAVLQMAADFRSAHSLSIPSGATASNEVLLVENQPSGSTTQVEWIYTPASGTTQGTLIRYTKSGSGSFVTSGVKLSGVANPSTTRLLTYYSDSGVSNSTTSSIANCTTRVSIDIVLAPPSSATGVSNFEVTQDVALTDQLAILTQPGSVQCASS